MLIHHYVKDIPVIPVPITEDGIAKVPVWRIDCDKLTAKIHHPLKECAALVSGQDFWFTAKGKAYPSIQVSDGPSGLRKQDDQNEKDMEVAVKLAQQSDQVIFFAGFPEAMETEGFDKTSISLPKNQIDLLERVSMANDNVTVVLQNGSAVEIPWADQVPAIVETYLAGEAVGQANWDVLSGKVNPSGKLAETFPLRLVANPPYGSFDRDLDNENYSEGLMVGYSYYDLHHYPVRFPFGHGLSYTSFDYRDLTITQSKTGVTVRFKLKNTGKLAGKEVAQTKLVIRLCRCKNYVTL